MNERMKILNLLQEGKLTVDQANMLIEALDEKEGPARPFGPRRPSAKTVDDWKNFGTQISNTVTQSLGDLKRTMEQQLENVSFGSWFSSISVSKSITLPENVAALSLDTKNGNIQIHTSDEPSVRIVIRAQIRTDEVDSAKSLLDAALLEEIQDNDYHLSAVHVAKDGLVRANFDVHVPRGISRFFLKTLNGNIQLENIDVEDIQAETKNGCIWVLGCQSKRLRLTSSNGNIDVHHSINIATQNVYATAKNGTVYVRNAFDKFDCTGSAKTSIGRIQIEHADLLCDEADATLKKNVSFKTKEHLDAGEQSPTAHLYLETKAGNIIVRA